MYLKFPVVKTPPMNEKNSIIIAAIIGPGKRWNHLPLSRNGKPLRKAMHVKNGDLVRVIVGDDSGTVGEVLSVYSKTGRIRVKGANKKIRNEKPMRDGESGKTRKSEGVINQSNVMHYSKEVDRRSRVGHMIEDGRKSRYLIKTGEKIIS